MQKTNGREITVRIANDDMEAYVLLARVSNQESYTAEGVIEELYRNKVTTGIDADAIERMITEHRYGREILVATGTPPVDGVDGYYQFNFNDDFNTRPTIRPDGTVDYWSVHAVELVNEGQVIAKYYEPVLGKNGVAVTGKVLLAKPGRNLPPLTGRGFERSEDNCTYTATISGKIERNKNRIIISSIYEIPGNVDFKTGNIDFRGDVLVHGNVNPGSSIRASGSVTIEGIVEACTIEAGKDIILRGGVLGGYKAVIKSKGNIYAKFMEYATVECEGFLEASSALDCTIECHDKVFLSGAHASIIGGRVYGAKGIEADTFGSSREVRTEIQAGVRREVIAKVYELRNRFKEDVELIERITEVLKQFEEAAREKNLDVSQDSRRVALLRTRIARQAQVSKTREELSKLDELMEQAKGATVRAIREVYPGVRITIDAAATTIKDYHESVEFFKRMDNVVMVSIRHELVK